MWKENYTCHHRSRYRPLREYQSLSRRKYFSSIKENCYYSKWPLSKNVTSEKNCVAELSIEFAAMMEMSHICTVATGHMWLLSTWSVARVIEQLNFKIYLVLINLNSNMWLAAAVWDSIVTANWHCPSLLMGKKCCLVWAQEGHRWVQEANQAVLWSLGGIGWFFIWVTVPSDRCLFSQQALGWPDFPLSQAAVGATGGDTRFMVSLKGQVLWIEALSPLSCVYSPLLSVYSPVSSRTLPCPDVICALEDWATSSQLVLRMTMCVFPTVRHFPWKCFT